MKAIGFLFFFVAWVACACLGDRGAAYRALDMNIKVEVIDFLDGVPEEQWHIKDISEWYGEWLLPDERLVRVTKYTPKKIAIVHLNGEGKGIVLNRPEGIPRLSSILSHRLKQFPDDAGERLLLMRRITALHFNPVYDVGSERLLKIHRNGIDEWLYGSVKDPSVFKKYCRNPIYNLNSDANNWSADFFVFKPDGGMDKVAASGKITPFSLESVSSEEELKAGSFSWPYWGK